MTKGVNNYGSQVLRNMHSDKPKMAYNSYEKQKIKFSDEKPFIACWQEFEGDSSPSRVRANGSQFRTPQK